MVDLRLYQQKGVEEIRAAMRAGDRRVLYVAPTGAGKTTLFSYIAGATAERGKRVAILAHRAELVDQASATLARFGVEHGVIAAGHHETEHSVQVASIATLARRLDRIPPFDLGVVDEAHHAAAGTWAKIMAAWPEAYFLGVSASPARLDGKGLASAFDRLIVGPSVSELMEAGHLCRYRVFVPPHTADLSKVGTRAGDFAPEAAAAVMSEGGIVGSGVDHYRRHAAGIPAVAFAVNRDHSRSIVERFRAAGYRAEHLDGDTPADDRRNIVAALGRGLHLISNCNLLSEGFDCPSIGATLLMRPTMSVALHIQQVGRGLRPAPGKDRAIILDHAGNVARLGFPDDDREWSLGDLPKAKREAVKVPGQRCPLCEAFNPVAALTCAECGAELVRSAEEIRETEAELVELSRISLATQLKGMPYAEAIRWADTEEKLRQVAKARGYHNQWVRHQIHERGGPAPRRFH